MAGYRSEGIELLVSPKIQRGRQRRTYAATSSGGSSSGYHSEGGAAGRTVEDATTGEMDWLDVPPPQRPAVEEEEDCFNSTSYLSDHGLPSERARIAAGNQYRELQRSGRHDITSSERTPLLASQTKETALAGSGNSSEPVLLRLREKDEDKEELLPHKPNDLRVMEGRGESVREEKKRLRLAKYTKLRRTGMMGILTVLLVICVILFSINHEHEYPIRIITADASLTTPLVYDHHDHWSFVVLSINGPLFKDESFQNSSGQECEDFLFFCSPDINSSQFCSVSDSSKSCQSVRIVTKQNISSSSSSFTASSVITRELTPSQYSEDKFKIEFLQNTGQSVSFQISTRGELLSQDLQVLVATCILIGVYLLITFDIVHRTLAAFIGSTATLATLSMLQKRPTLDTVVEWVDLDTIFLLFGMMTLVAIFSQTGFFDYSAVKAYKVAKGKIGPLITILCLLSAIVSAFLDNVTTILLLTPVSIRLCQVLNVNPMPVLIAEVVFSNIGGTATAVGDPPNVIIVSSDLIQSYGIDFAEFTLHLSMGIILCMGVAYVVLACIYMTCVRLPNKDPPHIAEMKREIAIWERTALQMPVVSLEETAVRDALRTKAIEVRNQLQREVLLSVKSAQDMWQTNLEQLETQYRITNPILLAKSASVLLVVILLFFLANVIPGFELELGWIAIFGAVILLVLADTQDLDPILHKIEWSTLLFFAGLFVLMEGLQELGLIQFIGDGMVSLIKMVPASSQMTLALVLVVWISALASSFIDNIPFTTATIPVIVELANSPEVCVSLRPLVWALAFGACLGGNGTLIGASANVVCAGIAEQNGYKISFFKFFTIGFPMMLATTMTAMIYLLICHIALGWNVDDSCPQ